MLQRDAIKIIRQYAANLNNAGYAIDKTFLSGSFACNEAYENN